MTTHLDTDVAVIGAGLGGIAAALAAADAGCLVVLTEAETVIGGQVTSQLVAPLDEHPLVETTGVTASYRRFRDLIRAEYDGTPNPGAGWVSRLCFEPAVGLRVLHRILDPHVASGAIRILTGHRVVSCELRSGRLQTVELEAANGGSVRLSARVFADATELGDLLPMAGADWVVGSEGSDAYGEPEAVPGPPDPRAEQSCTWVAALSLGPADPTTGPRTRAGLLGCAHLRDTQPFSFAVDGADGTTHRYRFGVDGPDGRPPFWTYRRVRVGSGRDGRDLAVLNWPGNDYRGAGLVADPARARQGARRLTEAFVHWLRTEAPRDDGGRGHPELSLCPEAALSSDGLALAPYVRESRRLRTGVPVTGHDLQAAPGSERATALPDAVGVAWYHADLHARIGQPASAYTPTAPFQIPLRALVAGRPVNLLAAAKNLGATQVAAAAYRVHPGEWAIGEAAGVVAAQAAADGDVRALAASPERVRRVQVALLHRGAPLVWSTDLVPGHPAFVAGQLLAVHGGLTGERLRRLGTRPDEPADGEDLAALHRARTRIAGTASGPGAADGRPWAEAALALTAGLLDRSPTTNLRRRMPA